MAIRNSGTLRPRHPSTRCEVCNYGTTTSRCYGCRLSKDGGRPISAGARFMNYAGRGWAATSNWNPKQGSHLFRATTRDTRR